MCVWVVQLLSRSLLLLVLRLLPLYTRERRCTFTDWTVVHVHVRAFVRGAERAFVADKM